MKISIIIPYFNRKNTISRCINSIFKDDLQNIDIDVIVVNDFSEQPVPNLNVKNIRILNLEKNMGPVAARSFGADVALGDYFLFLDSDDELCPGWSNRLLSEIQAADFVGFPYAGFNQKEDVFISSSFDYWKWTASDSRASDYIWCVKKQAYRKHQWPKLNISELWYFSQIFDSNLTAKYCKNPLYIYHQDAGNQVSKSRQYRFKLTNYEKKSIRYSIKIFYKDKAMIKAFSPVLYSAWKKSLIKQSLLSLNLFNAVAILVA